MRRYVPIRDVQRLAIQAESDGNIFPDESKANRIGNKIADDIRECIETNAVDKDEICTND